ncbi:MAG: phage shock protein A [Beggiatoa sp. IS2]|nr:MAG: phage shock protein A [Beggiatoa sp. IS2]
MGIFGKLLTALRGAATETGEAIADTQAIRILDQEMRDAKKYLDEAKENLTKVMAEQMAVERVVKKLRDAIKEYEGYALQALDKGDEPLAVELSGKVAELENQLEAEQNVLDGYNVNITDLKEVMGNTDHHIKSMEREISVVKTTASVQKANEAVATDFSGSDSALRSASDSLERIKEKQQQKTDQMKAALELHQQESGDSLQAKLKDAGIVKGNASSKGVLERLKASRNATVEKQTLKS